MEVSRFYGGKHPSELPFYSQREVARQINVPFSTLRTWLQPVRGTERYEQAYCRPLIQPPDGERGRLSFLNFNEAYVIAELQRKAGASLHAIRMFVGRAREEYSEPRPLLLEEILASGDVFRYDDAGRLENMSRGGQFAFKEIMGDYLTRIERDSSGLPESLFPWIVNTERKSVELNPRIKFGQPVLAGRGITTATIRERYDAGESLEHIADGYGIDDLALLKDALKYERQS